METASSLVQQYIFSHRVHPTTHQGFLTIAHCAFSPQATGRGNISSIQLRGQGAKYIFGTSPQVDSTKDISDDKTLRGLPVAVSALKPINVATKSDEAGNFCEIVVPEDFPPGAVAVFSTYTTDLTDSLDAFCISGANEAFSELNLVDLNVVLYRADGEERDLTGQDGVYNVPGMGGLVYCGLEGWMFPLRHVMRYNDLGHPLCDHLRNGCWAMDYVQGRLQKSVLLSLPVAIGADEEQTNNRVPRPCKASQVV